MERKIPENSPFNNKHYHHIGVIVKDMEKTIAYLSSIGIGPFGMAGGKKWVEVPFKGELRGQPAAWKVKVSNAKLGGGELELLQPSGGKSLLQEFLDDHGEGLHHIGYITDNLDRNIKALAGQGIKVLTSAVAEKGGFAYFDTGVNGGIVTESETAIKGELMKAAVLRGIGNLNVEDVPEPEPGPDEVKVKIAFCGLCGTDPENMEGRFGLIPREAYEKPQIMGHEASGTIVASGKNIKGYRVGQRVACDFKGACGKCYYCRNKMEHFCTQAKRASGSFADYAVYPESAIYALPDNVSLEAGSFLEPVSVAVHAIDIAGVRPGGTVAISGAGPIGLLCLQMALRAGAARVMVSEPVAGKREVAKKLGADVTADPEENLEEIGLKLTEGRGFDTVIEASSDLEAAKLAISLVGKCGTVVWAAVYPVEAEIGVPPFTMYAKELTIRSVFVSPYCFPRALNLLPKLDIKSLITNIMPLKDIQKAFELHATGKPIKILIQP